MDLNLTKLRVLTQYNKHACMQLWNTHTHANTQLTCSDIAVHIIYFFQ